MKKEIDFVLSWGKFGTKQVVWEKSELVWKSFPPFSQKEHVPTYCATKSLQCSWKRNKEHNWHKQVKNWEETRPFYYQNNEHLQVKENGMGPLQRHYHTKHQGYDHLKYYTQKKQKRMKQEMKQNKVNEETQ